MTSNQSQITQSKLLQSLSDKLPKESFHLTVLESVDSTNTWLQTQSAINKANICIANHQTAGRGRFGKQWDSAPNESICFSLRIPTSKSVDQLMGFSLIIALAVKAVIAPKITSDLQLKWPNDILADGKKLCGILIETNTTSTESIDLIIGIGINVFARGAEQYQATSLAELGLNIVGTSHNSKQNGISHGSYSQTKINQDGFISELISQVIEYSQRYEMDGFETFRAEWLAQDRWLGSQVEISHSNGASEQGIYSGLDAVGQVQIEIDGKIKTFNSGEISFRQVQR